MSFFFSEPKHVRPATCPHCDAHLDGVRGIDNDELPEPGAVTLCFYCAKVGVFTEIGTLRRPTASELRELAQDPRITMMKGALEQRLREEGS